MTEGKETKLSPRDQLAALMKTQETDQDNAIREALSFFGSSDAKAFYDKVASFRDRTVPNSHFDQVFSSLLRVVDSTKEMAATVVRAFDEAAERRSNQEKEAAAQLNPPAPDPVVNKVDPVPVKAPEDTAE